MQAHRNEPLELAERGVALVMGWDGGRYHSTLDVRTRPQHRTAEVRNVFINSSMRSRAECLPSDRANAKNMCAQLFHFCVSQPTGVGMIILRCDNNPKPRCALGDKQMEPPNGHLCIRYRPNEIVNN